MLSTSDNTWLTLQRGIITDGMPTTSGMSGHVIDHAHMHLLLPGLLPVLHLGWVLIVRQVRV